MKEFKCRNCGGVAKPTAVLREIWDVYYKARLCPDCYDLGARIEVQSKIFKRR